MSRPTYQGAPFQGDLPSWARRAAEVILGLLQGKTNNVLEVTLAAGAASTTLSDPRIGYYSHLGFMPMTANAAAELGAGTLYVAQATMKSGAAVISHANNVQTDRTFRVVITG